MSCRSEAECTMEKTRSAPQHSLQPLSAHELAGKRGDTHCVEQSLQLTKNLFKNLASNERLWTRQASEKPRPRHGTEYGMPLSRDKLQWESEIHLNPKPQKQHSTSAVRDATPAVRATHSNICMPEEDSQYALKNHMISIKKMEECCRAMRRHVGKPLRHTRMCEPRAAKDPASTNRETDNCSQPATNQEQGHADEARRRCEETHAKERTIEGRPRARRPWTPKLRQRNTTMKPQHHTSFPQSACLQDHWTHKLPFSLRPLSES